MPTRWRAISAMPILLMLLSCVSSYGSYGGNDDLASIQPKLQEGFREAALKAKKRYASSFRTRACSAASKEPEYAVDQLNGILQPELSDYARSLASSQITKMFSS